MAVRVDEIDELLKAFGGVLHLKNVDLNDSKLKLDALYAYELELMSKLQSCRKEIGKAQESYFEHCTGVNMWVQAYEAKLKEIVDAMKV